MKFQTKPVLLAAALGLPAMLAGCQSRAEVVSSRPAKSPVRTVSASSETDESAIKLADASDEDQTVKQVVRSQQPAERSQPPARSFSQAATTARPPRAILNEAGAVLETDEQGRTVGLDLTEAQISAPLTWTIGRMRHLQWADMRGTHITNADLAVICTQPQFELIALSQTQVTDTGLRCLRGQRRLRFLSLDDTAVTDVGLQTLAGLPRLEAVRVVGTSVSKAAARDFEIRKPGCRVILDEDAPETSSPQHAELPWQPAPESEQHAEPIEPISTASNAPWAPQPTKPQPAPQPSPDVSATTTVSATAQQTQITGQTLGQILQQRLLDPEVLTALSQHLLARQQYSKATRVLQALAELQPDNAQIQFDLGVALGRIGEYDQAHPHLAAVVGDATAYYNLGIIAYERSEHHHSETYFGRAIDLAPDFDEARTWLDRVRQTSAAKITPASHTPGPADRSDLVDLLMSEFGASDPAPGRTAPAPQQNSQGITIVPSGR